MSSAYRSCSSRATAIQRVSHGDTEKTSFLRGQNFRHKPDFLTVKTVSLPAENETAAGRLPFAIKLHESESDHRSDIDFQVVARASQKINIVSSLEANADGACEGLNSDSGVKRKTSATVRDIGNATHEP